MALFLFLILVAVVLGIIGAVVEGLFYLLIIGIVLLVAALAFIGVRWSRRSGRRTIRGSGRLFRHPPDGGNP
jgi:membrane protein implicated in regulation of membrane protease activity